MPIDVPWFPGGDPLLPENRGLEVKVLHRYIGDIYQTYDVLYALQWGRGPTNALWPLKGFGVIVPAFQFISNINSQIAFGKWMVYERFTPWLDAWADGYLAWILEIHAFYQGRYSTTSAAAEAYIEEGIPNYDPESGDLDFTEDINDSKEDKVLKLQRKDLSITYLVTDSDLSVTKVRAVMDSDFKISIGQGPILIHSVVVNGPPEIKELVETRLNSLSEYLLWNNRSYPTFYIADEDNLFGIGMGEIRRTTTNVYYWDVLEVDVYAWKKDLFGNYDWFGNIVGPDEYPIDVIKSANLSMKVPGLTITQKTVYDPETQSYVLDPPVVIPIPYDDTYFNRLEAGFKYLYYKLPFSASQNETREKSRFLRQFKEVNTEITNSRENNGIDIFYDSISALRVEFANNNYWNDLLAPPPDVGTPVEAYIAKEVRDFPNRDPIEDQYLEIRFRVPTSPTMTSALFGNRTIDTDRAGVLTDTEVDHEFYYQYDRDSSLRWVNSNRRAISSIQVFNEGWIDSDAMVLVPAGGPGAWSPFPEFPAPTVAIAMLGGGVVKGRFFTQGGLYRFYPRMFTKTTTPLAGSAITRFRQWVSTADETGTDQERAKNNDITLLDRANLIAICDHWWSVTTTTEEEEEAEVKNTMVDSIRVKNNNVYLQELSRLYGIRSPFDDYSIEPLTAVTDGNLDPQAYPTFKFAKDARLGNPASSWGTAGVKVVQSSTRFEGNPETGQEQIVFDEFYQAHNILQVLATIGEQVDRVLDFLATSANYITPAHSRGQLCKVEGIYSLLSETLYMNSQLDQTTKKTLINSALCQAMLIELIRHKGVEATTKYLLWDIGAGEVVRQPYEALAPNAPTEYRQYADILENLAYLLAGATKAVVEAQA